MTAVMGAEVRIEVLGPCRVMRGADEVEFTRQDRRVLTALAHLCHGGAMVDSEVVEEHAWRRLPSPRALRSTVYRVRKALGDDIIITRRRSVGLGPVANCCRCWRSSVNLSPAADLPNCSTSRRLSSTR